MSTTLYALTNQLAAFEAPDTEMQQLLGALPGNVEQTNRFLGVLAGTIRVEASRPTTSLTSSPPPVLRPDSSLIDRRVTAATP